MLKIGFRIVSAALALCVIPAAYFLDFIRFRVTVSILPKAIQDDVSIKRIVDLLAPGGSFNGLFGSGKGNLFANAAVKSLMPAAICFAVFFALAIILSLVIFFFAAFSKKQLVITFLGAAGLLAVIAAYISFGQIAAPLLKGTISIGDFLSMGLLGTIVASAVKITVFRLTSATLIMALAFSAIVIWGLAFIVTDDGSSKKPVKKVIKPIPAKTE